MARRSMIEALDGLLAGRVSTQLLAWRTEGLTSAQMAHRFGELYGVTVDRSTISRWLGRLDEREVA